MKILLACDRSRGHLYPALVLARHIKENYPEHEVVFYGLKKEDRSYLRKEGFMCLGQDLAFRNIILESSLRFVEALLLIPTVRPGKVLGFGGRNSFFIILICSLFVPTFLFEPNVTFGKANKILSFFVKAIFLGIRKPRKPNQISTGIPLREEIMKNRIDKGRVRDTLGLCPDTETILVFGGSLGSSFINDVFTGAASLLNKNGYKFQVIHITGNKDFSKIVSLYKIIGIKAKVFSFYDKMNVLYSASDFIISRSGASTVAEICFFGKAALLIPYPYAYAHQRKNASFLFVNRAALLEEQHSLNEQKLYRIISRAIERVEEFSYLSNNAGKLKIWNTQKDFSEEILRHLQ